MREPARTDLRLVRTMMGGPIVRATLNVPDEHHRERALSRPLAAHLEQLEILGASVHWDPAGVIGFAFDESAHVAMDYGCDVTMLVAARMHEIAAVARWNALRPLFTGREAIDEDA